MGRIVNLENKSHEQFTLYRWLFSTVNSQQIIKQYIDIFCCENKLSELILVRKTTQDERPLQVYDPPFKSII